MGTGLALAVGLLLGAERQRGHGAGFGGVRTFPLYALAGAVGGLFGGWVLAAFAVCVGAFLTVAYVRASAGESPDLGMSTEVTALVAFALGALSTTEALGLGMRDRAVFVAALATATLALLALKAPLHGFVSRVSQEDVYATTRVLVLAAIVLPLLPDEDLGPWDSINPRAIGVLVLLVLGISFVGYVAMRVLGPRRGLALSGLLGGLASSTATTLVLARTTREAPGAVAPVASAIALAGGVMFPRILLEVAVASPSLAWASAPAFGTAGAVALLGAGVAHWTPSQRPPGGGPELPVANPMTLRGAGEFGLVFAVVLLISGFAAERFAAAGVLATAAATGSVDASAIALSVGRLHAVGRIDVVSAQLAVAIGAAANTAAKVALAGVVGGPRLALRTGAVLAAALAAGALVLALRLDVG